MTTTPAATEPAGNTGEALASVPQQAAKGYLPLPPHPHPPSVTARLRITSPLRRKTCLSVQISSLLSDSCALTRGSCSSQVSGIRNMAASFSCMDGQIIPRVRLDSVTASRFLRFISVTANNCHRVHKMWDVVYIFGMYTVNVHLRVARVKRLRMKEDSWWFSLPWGGLLHSRNLGSQFTLTSRRPDHFIYWQHVWVWKWPTMMARCSV